MAPVAKKVLIIEDDPSLRDALYDALTRAGLSCTSTEDGESGLQMALTEKPDLIMLDLLLPKMDGTSMLSKLREDAWGVNARVLILTNLSADQGERVRTIVDTYPEYYLIKSDWSIQDIVEKTHLMLS